MRHRPIREIEALGFRVEDLRSQAFWYNEPYIIYYEEDGIKCAVESAKDEEKAEKAIKILNDHWLANSGTTPKYTYACEKSNEST